VENQDGQTVYTAPNRDGLEELINEAVSDISTCRDEAIVGAAMAHLNLTLVHPFSDGNGRMARCVQ
jgi:Fic family protein